MKYEFSLVLTAKDVTDEQADKLFAAGCQDGSILSRGRVHFTMVQFDGEAKNLDEVLSSAIRDVKKQAFRSPRRNRVARRAASRVMAKSST